MRISDWSSDVCSSDLLDEPGPLQQGFYFFQHSCWRKSSRINDLPPICRLQRCDGAIAVALVSGASLLATGRDSSLTPLCAQLLVPTLRALVGAGFREDFQLPVGEPDRAHELGRAHVRNPL